VASPRWAISIGLALAAIGFVGAAQWNSSSVRQTVISSAQGVLVIQAEQRQREQEQLRAQIEEAEDRVREFQEQSAGSQSATDRLNQDLAAARLAVGLSDVTGPGVVIEIADSTRQVPVGENPSNYFVLSDDLRDIVTALWASGAEAITIAGGATEGGAPAERIVSTTSIYGAGSAILVNQALLSPPFRIEAIGPDGLQDRFLANPFYIGRLSLRIETFGLQFASEARDELRLPAFIGNTRLRWGAPERTD
ncbi:MAG TPA: DUF881 domain-containing protein, partial [Candidatus Limnocylindria bacterium]|nr:DUF881 domain-containing protein [Candidatus Limnocylindria bacterium]